MLESAACEIQKLFKSEAKETYFIGYQKTEKVKRAARGKLWSRFVNVRNALRSAEGKTVKKSSPKALVNGMIQIMNCKIFINMFCILFADKKDELEILSTIIEPKEKVLVLWNETFQQRSYILKVSNLSVEELFYRYAALSTSF